MQIGSGGAEPGKGSLEDLARQLQQRGFLGATKKVQALTQSGTFKFGILKPGGADAEWLQLNLQQRVMQRAEARLVDIEQHGGDAADVAKRLNELGGLLQQISDGSGVDMDQVKGLKLRLDKLAAALTKSRVTGDVPEVTRDAALSRFLTEAQDVMHGEESRELTAIFLNLIYAALSQRTTAEGPSSIRAADVRSNTERIFLMLNSCPHLCGDHATWPRSRYLMSPFAMYLCMRRNIGELYEGNKMQLERASELVTLAKGVQLLLQKSKDPWERSLLALVSNKAQEASRELEAHVERVLDPNSEQRIDSAERALILLKHVPEKRAAALQQHLLSRPSDELLGPKWGLSRSMHAIGLCSAADKVRIEDRQIRLVRDFQPAALKEFAQQPTQVLASIPMLSELATKYPHCAFAIESTQANLLRGALRAIASPNFDKEALLADPQRLGAVCNLILTAPEHLQDFMTKDSLAPLQAQALQALCTAKYGEGDFVFDLTEFCRVPKGEQVQIQVQAPVLARMNGQPSEEGSPLTGVLGFLSAESRKHFSAESSNRFRLTNDDAVEVTFRGGLAAIMHSHGFPIQLEEGHPAFAEWNETSLYLYGLQNPWEHPCETFYRQGINELCDTQISCGSVDIPVCSVVLRDAGVAPGLDWSAVANDANAIEPLVQYMHDGQLPAAELLPGMLRVTSGMGLKKPHQHLLSQMTQQVLSLSSGFLDGVQKAVAHLDSAEMGAIGDMLKTLLQEYTIDPEVAVENRLAELPALLGLLKQLEMHDERQMLVDSFKRYLDDTEHVLTLSGMRLAEDYQLVRVILAAPLDERLPQLEAQLRELASNNTVQHGGFGGLIDICASARLLNVDCLPQLERRLAQATLNHSIGELTAAQLRLLGRLDFRNVSGSALAFGLHNLARFLEKNHVPCDLRGQIVPERFVSSLVQRGYPCEQLSLDEASGLQGPLIRLLAGHTLWATDVHEIGSGLLVAGSRAGPTECGALLDAVQKGKAQLTDTAVDFLRDRIGRDAQLLDFALQLAEASGNQELIEVCARYIEGVRLDADFVEPLCQAPKVCAQIKGLFLSAQERYTLEQVQELLPLCSALEQLTVGVWSGVERLSWHLTELVQLSGAIAACPGLETLRVGPGRCADLLLELGTELPNLKKVRIRAKGDTDVKPEHLVPFRCRGVDIKGVNCSRIDLESPEVEKAIHEACARLAKDPTRLLRTLAGYHIVLGMPIERLLALANVKDLDAQHLMDVSLTLCLEAGPEHLAKLLGGDERSEKDAALLSVALAKKFSDFAGRKEIELALKCIQHGSIMNVDTQQMPTLLRLFKQLSCPQMQRQAANRIINAALEGEAVTRLERGRPGLLAQEAMDGVRLEGRVLQTEQWDKLTDFLIKHPTIKPLNFDTSNISEYHLLALLEAGRKPDEIDVSSCFRISDAESHLMQGRLPDGLGQGPLSALCVFLLVEYFGQEGVKLLAKATYNAPLTADACRILLGRREVCQQLDSLFLDEAAVSDLESTEQLLSACGNVRIITLDAGEDSCPFQRLGEGLGRCVKLRELRVGRGQFEGLLPLLCKNTQTPLRRIRFRASSSYIASDEDMMALAGQGIGVMFFRGGQAKVGNKQMLLWENRAQALRSVLKTLNPEQQLKHAARFYCMINVEPDAVLSCLDSPDAEKFREAVNAELLSLGDLLDHVPFRLSTFTEAQLDSFLDYAIKHYDAREHGSLNTLIGKLLTQRNLSGARFDAGNNNARVLMGSYLMEVMEKELDVAQIDAADLAELLERLADMASHGAWLDNEARARFSELIQQAENRLIPFSVSDGPEYEGLQQRLAALAARFKKDLEIDVEIQVEMDTSRDAEIARNMQDF